MLKYFMDNQKVCALCNTKLNGDSKTSICNECMSCADCCVGLEKLS